MENSIVILITGTNMSGTNRIIWIVAIAPRENPHFLACGILTAVDVPSWEKRTSGAKPERKLDQED